MSSEKKLMMTFESFGGRKKCKERGRMRTTMKMTGPKTTAATCFAPLPSFRTTKMFLRENSSCIYSDDHDDNRRVSLPERTVSLCSKFSDTRTTYSSKKLFLRNFLISVIILIHCIAGSVVESVPATVESLESKIKMFLESHCTMQNETLEMEEYKSFMSCGPSHGAGIVKNLGKIPEYKSTDGDQWTRATKREIISQCEVWPQDRTCQETTFRLIEKCFEKDQKFIFYFMFALTDVICQTAEQDQFVRFWQNGGDACLGNHIKTLKKDWSECFVKTSTVSNADVYRNFDEVMQCFRSQFDSDCFGEGSDEVLNEIMTEIRRVYRETNEKSWASSPHSANFPMVLFLTGLMTFFTFNNKRVLL